MPSDLIAELLPSDRPGTEASVAVEISEDDLARLQVLATVGGVGGPNSASFAELLRATLHRGIVESLGSVKPASPVQLPVSRGDGRVGAQDEHAPSRRTQVQIPRRVALLTAAVASFVLIVGSYAGHWTWTGLTQNGQVWDWMQLLLLPVAIGTFPLWLRFSPEMSPARRKILAVAVLAFGLFVLAGYLVPLSWTGFPGRTLWNWLTLIVLPITITTATVWPKTGRRFLPAYRAAVGALGAAWIVTVIGGYTAGWSWTGYPGNTLWEWVQLLLAPIAISTCVVPELIRLAAGRDPGDAAGMR